MTTATPPESLLDGNPLERITLTFGGMTSDATRRGFAHLWELNRRVGIAQPGAFVRLIQPAFHEGFEPSAGTHDKADVWDYEVVGWDDWYAESRLARGIGFADWVRTPAQGFTWHHHAASIGLPDSMYGALVPAQIDDFRRHALGLKGQHDSGDDPQCFAGGRLTHKLAPVFDYPTWKARYTMLNNDDKKWIKDTIDAAFAAAVGAERDKVVNAVWAEPVDTNDDGIKVTAKQAVRQIREATRP